MKKLLLIAALVLAAIAPTKAQERIIDTVVNGTRYAMLTGLSGSVGEYAEATVVDAAALTADLNNRLRKIAAYQAVAVPCAVASSLALYRGYMYDDAKFKAIGYGTAGIAVLCEVLSYCQLWTRKVYVNQDGLVIRLGQTTKELPRP